MRPDGDADLLVDFLPGARPGVLGVSAMMREFTALLDRRVDLAVRPALKPLIRMNEVVAANPGRELHVILDNLHTHKPKRDRWLQRQLS